MFFFLVKAITKTRISSRTGLIVDFHGSFRTDDEIIENTEKHRRREKSICIVRKKLQLHSIQLKTNLIFFRCSLLCFV